MSGSGKNLSPRIGRKWNVAKKAYEIAYALFRISAKIVASSVKEKLESQAIELLFSVNTEEYGNAAKAIAAIDAFIKFALDLNMISIQNGDILLREIAALNEGLVECLDKSEEVDVSRLFSSSPQVSPPVHSEADPKNLGPRFDLAARSNLDKSGNRQVVILDKIRQSGNCRFREIQDILPDCSERTIRYDLEELLERNLVERVGTGGPAISYRVRQTA